MVRDSIGDELGADLGNGFWVGGSEGVGKGVGGVARSMALAVVDFQVLKSNSALESCGLGGVSS